MLKYIKEYRFYIILFFFVLFPLLALNTSTRDPRAFRFHDRIIARVMFPFQAAITSVIDGAINIAQNYLFLLNVRQNNLELIDFNRQLQGIIVQLKEAESENERLKAALGFLEKSHLKAVAARVIATDASTEFRAIRINRGESSGITKDMAVLTSAGVVGRVFRTTARTADVVTILDILSSIDSVVARSRARGIVEGLTEEVCQLRFALRIDDIQTGDLLITSGLGGVFPKGLAVGTVSRVNKLPFGITQYVEVKPAVDFTKLEEVFVVSEVLTGEVGT